jgi:hypothetical protein
MAKGWYPEFWWWLQSSGQFTLTDAGMEGERGAIPILLQTFLRCFPGLLLQ